MKHFFMFHYLLNKRSVNRRYYCMEEKVPGCFLFGLLFQFISSCWRGEEPQKKLLIGRPLLLPVWPLPIPAILQDNLKWIYPINRGLGIQICAHQPSSTFLNQQDYLYIDLYRRNEINEVEIWNCLTSVKAGGAEIIELAILLFWQ